MSHIEVVQEATRSTETPMAGHEEWVAELPLAGGPVVRFRHVRPEDEPFIVEAIRTASRETLLHRFFSPMRSVSPDLLRQMLSIERAKEACLVGVVSERGAVQIICGARYVKLRPGAAEIALIVHDDFQRRGLGAFLLKLLARLAQGGGIRWFEAEVLASNHNMLQLFKKLAPRASGHWTGDVYHIVMDVQTVVHGEAVSTQ